MTTNDAPGPRIDAAKTAAHNLIGALPDDATIGLQTYGTTTGSAPEDKPAGCKDVTTVIPLGPLNRDTFNTKIDTITPSGYTPISLALTTAADQLPTDTSPQGIVLVSDGEDTCDTPPCDTATALKKTHPALTISAVGFKLDAPAADQLRCIANTTGGLFVTAANATQLTARLLATQNINQANQSLSSTGMGGIELGATIGDIRAKHPDFPDTAATGHVTVIWRDCDYDFLDGTLDAIRPHNGGRTIDGLTAGSPVAKATELYGQPLATTPSNDNTTDLTYSADNATNAAYQLKVDGYNSTGTNAPSGTIKTITLCRCKPQARALSNAEVEAAPPGGIDGTAAGHWQESWSTLDFDYRYDLVVGPSGAVFGARYTLLPNGPLGPPDATMIGTLKGDVVTVVNAEGFWTDRSNYRVRPIGPGSSFTMKLETRGDERYLLTTGFIKASNEGGSYTDVGVAWCSSDASQAARSTCHD